MSNPDSTIPPGPYCYELLGVSRTKAGMPVLYTRGCPDYSTWRGGWCKSLHVPVEDKCKACGVNEEFGEDENG